MFQVFAYIKFLFSASNQHGVHSPFVYNLVTQCFYDKKSYPDYKSLVDFKKQLRNSKEIISVTDFGAGSKVFTSNKRAVSDIAKNAGIVYKRAKLLYRIMAYFKPQKVLELGTSLGIATQAMAKGHAKATITSVEGCPETAKIASVQLQKHNVNSQISIINNDFDSFLSSKENLKNYNLIYFDGNHTKKATLLYFNELLTCINNDSVFIFDDIHWSKEMEEAWKEIKQHEKVTLTIDTFYQGFVFFRNENKHKEHFKIRL